MTVLHSYKELEELREKIISRRNTSAVSITLCSGTGCLAYGSNDTFSAFELEIKKQGLAEKVEVRRIGCHGFCGGGPIALIQPGNICYLGVKAKEVPDIVSKTLIKNKLVERLLYKDPETGDRVVNFDEIPFYKYQKRVLLTNNGLVSPRKIEDYLAVGGYSALSKVLSGWSKDDVIKVIKDSNLRGRGGGGFPTGRKWETTRNAPGDKKYVLINADEGDPGAFMDGSLMEGNPHSVLEGLIIGGYAIGAKEGFVYVREEYPLALEKIDIAIKTAREYGLLGVNILGSGFDFDVTIHRGAGAFVSGESSALMSAVEGHVGEPRPKYIHTSEKGLWDSPSCLNNVETWANVPHIINNGSDWFNSIGTEKSKGTKIFSLVGKIHNTGLVEVPMGTPMRDIVYRIGGGIPGGKKFKAVQTGGPSGGVLPESMLDIPVDFDKLTEAGSMMGSGGMIIMDESTCMVDTARYYINFLAHESCGKCVPCREGLRQMLRILNNITRGEGKDGDIELLEELSEMMREASLCALGQSAPNPVLSTIRHFRSEYEAHIRESRCPAGVCKAMITYRIDHEKCIGCGICMKNCPTNAIFKIEDKKLYEIRQEDCVKCGSCITVCPEKAGAVILENKIRLEENV